MRSRARGVARGSVRLRENQLVLGVAHVRDPRVRREARGQAREVRHRIRVDDDVEVVTPVTAQRVQAEVGGAARIVPGVHIVDQGPARLEVATEPGRGLELVPHVALGGDLRVERPEVAIPARIVDAIGRRGDRGSIGRDPQRLGRVHVIAGLEGPRRADPLRSLARRRLIAERVEDEVPDARPGAGAARQLGDRFVQQRLQRAQDGEPIVERGIRRVGIDLGIGNVAPQVRRGPDRQRLPHFPDAEPRRIAGRAGQRLHAPNVHQPSAAVYLEPVSEVRRNVRRLAEHVVTPLLHEPAVSLPAGPRRRQVGILGELGPGQECITARRPEEQPQ